MSVSVIFFSHIHRVTLTTDVWISQSSCTTLNLGGYLRRQLQFETWVIFLLLRTNCVIVCFTDSILRFYNTSCSYPSLHETHFTNTFPSYHYGDVIMGAISSQITSRTIVYTTVYWDADERKHQGSASLAFVRGIHRGPVNAPHKWPVTRKMFPFDDVITFDSNSNSIKKTFLM